MIDMAGYISLKEAAKLLGVHVETVRRAMRQKKLEVVQIGRGYRVSQKALEAYVRGQMVGTRAGEEL